MKREHEEEKDPSMFEKLHHSPKPRTNHPQSPPPPPPAFRHSLHLSPSEPNDTPSSAADDPNPTNDGATVEVVRRPRGRPAGSKNKPKPPVIINRESEPSMSPYIIELPGGIDIVHAMARFCRNRDLGICILTGSGTVTVTNVTLRQPSTTPGATVTFHGRFDILSISATVLSADDANIPSLNCIANGFRVSMAGPQGQVFGGAVIGPLMSAGTVYLVAASFCNPSYDKLPLEDEGTGSGNEESQQRSPAAVSGGGGDGGMSVYDCHLPAHDVIWAPTATPARQPAYFS